VQRLARFKALRSSQPDRLAGLPELLDVALASHEYASLTSVSSATRRALFDAFDLRITYDKAGDRPSICATLTEAVASMLRGGLEPRLLKEVLRGWDSNPQPLD
jgi:hypothetical protein